MATQMGTKGNGHLASACADPQLHGHLQTAILCTCLFVWQRLRFFTGATPAELYHRVRSALAQAASSKLTSRIDLSIFEAAERAARALPFQSISSQGRTVLPEGKDRPRGTLGIWPVAQGYRSFDRGPETETCGPFPEPLAPSHGLTMTKGILEALRHLLCRGWSLSCG